MRIKILLLLVSLAMSVTSLANELVLTGNAPKSYVVKKGDTLWDIASVFLKKPWLWPKLWRINPQVNNPDLIYPGDELRIVFDEKGLPMLIKLTKGKADITDKAKVKWSPRVRSQLKNQNPVRSLPLQVIAPFIRYDQVKSVQELELLPAVIGSEKGYKSNVDGVKVYVNSDLIVGQSYAFYQKGEAIIDPKSQQMLGYNVKHVGTGKATANGDISQKKPSTIYIEDAIREIRAGAYVMPVNDNQQYPSFFTMRAADSIHGLILSSSTKLREFAKYDVVMINKGRADNIQVGDVLTVSRKNVSAQEADYELPIESVGQVMIFKVYEKVSSALIISSEKPIRVFDSVVSP